MNPYVPVIVMIAVAGALGVAGLLVSAVLGPKRYNEAKLDRYESGPQATPPAVGGGRIPIKYFLVAMTFIVFDVEVVFLYPWAIAYEKFALFGYVAIVTFLVMITIPFIYEWRRGGFDWE